MKPKATSSAALATAITLSASRQTYSTIRLLVDRDLVPQAMRAYAYFRWVDDILDKGALEKPERLGFIDRQAALLERCEAGEHPRDVRPEERMLVDLVHYDHRTSSGLRSYEHHMMAVMRFDAQRRYHLISLPELNEYARLLATAVTDALHYFIGNRCAAPARQDRYLAATGAHITHMLRDALEDNRSGYVNLPAEYIREHHLDLQDAGSPAFRAWVRERVRLARDCFRTGRQYLRQVSNTRCRIAGWAYIARFEVVLDLIEQDDFVLRSDYRVAKELASRLLVGRSVLAQALGLNGKRTRSSIQAT